MLDFIEKANKDKWDDASWATSISGWEFKQEDLRIDMLQPT